jgi:hypothetical protein
LRIARAEQILSRYLLLRLAGTLERRAGSYQTFVQQPKDNVLAKLSLLLCKQLIDCELDTRIRAQIWGSRGTLMTHEV